MRSIRLGLTLTFAITAGLACSNSSSDPDFTPPSAEALQTLERLEAEAKALDAHANPDVWQSAWRAALSEAQTLYPEGHPRLEVIRGEIAFGDFLKGNVQEALAALEASIPIYAAGGEAWRDKYTESLGNLGTVMSMMGNHETARALSYELMEARRADDAEETFVELGVVVDNVAMTERNMGNPDLALQLNAEAIRLHEARLADNPELAPKFAVALTNRLLYLRDAGRFEDAEREVRLTTQRVDALLPEDHPSRSYIYQSAGDLLNQAGFTEDAIALVRRAVELRERGNGREAPNAAIPRQLLVSLLLKNGRHEEALALASFNRPILVDGYGPTSREALLSGLNMAEARYGLGMEAEAKADFATLLPEMRTHMAASQAERIDAEILWATLRIRDDDVEPARDDLAAALAALDVTTGRKDSRRLRLEALHSLTRALSETDESLRSDLQILSETLIARSLSDARGADRARRQDPQLSGAMKALVAAAVEIDETDIAFRAMQALGFDQASLAADRSARRRQLGPDMAEQLRRRDQLSDRQADADRKVMAALAEGRADAAREWLDVSDGLSREFEEADSRLGAQTARASSPVQSLEETQTRLTDAEGLWLNTSSPFGTYSILVTAEEALVYRSGITDEDLLRRVTRLRRATEPGPDMQPADRLLIDYAELTRDLLGLTRSRRSTASKLCPCRRGVRWHRSRPASSVPMALSGGRTVSRCGPLSPSQPCPHPTHKEGRHCLSDLARRRTSAPSVFRRAILARRASISGPWNCRRAWRTCRPSVSPVANSRR